MEEYDDQTGTDVKTSIDSIFRDHYDDFNIDIHLHFDDKCDPRLRELEYMTITQNYVQIIAMISQDELAGETPVKKDKKKARRSADKEETAAKVDDEETRERKKQLRIQTKYYRDLANYVDHRGERMPSSMPGFRH